MANEQEVEALFRAHGFEVIYPEAVGFREQLDLYGGCSVIAGPAGSNMHNSAFLPRSASVIVLAPASFAVRASHLISAARKLDLYYYFADVGDMACNTQRPWRVDLKDLETCLDRCRFV
jgi:capsular polysaccharide biosynthesis protein